MSVTKQKRTLGDLMREMAIDDPDVMLAATQAAIAGCGEPSESMIRYLIEFFRSAVEPPFLAASITLYGDIAARAYHEEWQRPRQALQDDL